MPYCVIMVGPPGSGKTTLFKKKLRPSKFVSVSRDEIRETMFGKRYKQNPNDEKRVTLAFNHILQMAVDSKQNIALDNTHCNRKYLDEARWNMIKGDYKVFVHFMDTPKWLCKVRVLWRTVCGGRWVPFKVIDRMFEQYNQINRNNYETI